MADETPDGPEPRWLSEEEQQAWRGLLAVDQLLFEALDRQMQADAGIPHAYYVILAMLSEAPERTLRMTELAGVTRTSQSRMSHAVARLEERGFVERVASPTDRRSTLARLTDAGHSFVVRTAPGHVSVVREHVFDRLSPEQVTEFLKITDAILGSLRPPTS